MRKNYPFLIFISCMLILIITSCASKKDIAYFQKNTSPDTLTMVQAYIPKIQVSDILAISVTSLDPESDRMFNPYTMLNAQSATGAQQGVTTQLSQAPSNGYVVDEKGQIILPLVGALKVTGQTTSQLRDTISRRLLTFLKEPTVNVRLMNYKVSVLGEVARPSTFLVPNERITITEAISLAGDLTITGKRSNILVIREENGKKEFGQVNLNDRGVFSSKYYYLHPNDIVYIEPSRGKIAQSDQTLTQIASVALSALSLIATIVLNVR